MCIHSYTAYQCTQDGVDETYALGAWPGHEGMNTGSGGSYIYQNTAVNTCFKQAGRAGGSVLSLNNNCYLAHNGRDAMKNFDSLTAVAITAVNLKNTPRSLRQKNDKSI